MNMHTYAHVLMHTYTHEGDQLSQFSQNCPGFFTENPTPWKNSQIWANQDTWSPQNTHPSNEHYLV